MASMIHFAFLTSSGDFELVVIIFLPNVELWRGALATLSSSVWI
jgi:hypothetical protein